MKELIKQMLEDEKEGLTAYEELIETAKKEHADCVDILQDILKEEKTHVKLLTEILEDM